METAIKGDVAILRAWKVDEAGNCQFRWVHPIPKFGRWTWLAKATPRRLSVKLWAKLQKLQLLKRRI
jgi:3-oxoacid CoA-transferase